MNNDDKVVSSSVSIRGADTNEKAMEMIGRYQVCKDPTGIDLAAAIKSNATANPVALVAQTALYDYGLSGIDVIRGNPEQLFEVTDVESANCSLSNLRASIAASKLTEDHASITEAMSAMFTDVMEDVGHIVQLTERRSLRRGM